MTVFYLAVWQFWVETVKLNSPIYFTNVHAQSKRFPKGECLKV